MMPKTKIHKKRHVARMSTTEATFEIGESGGEKSIRIQVDGGEKFYDTIDIPSWADDRILRNQLTENGVDLTTVWGKMKSCNGAGQCGTCIVKINKGMG